MVGDHEVFADPVPEIVSHPLRQAAGVGEDQNRPMLRGQSLEPIVDLAPHLVGGDRGKLLVRRLHRDPPGTDVPDVNDGARLCPWGRFRRAGEEGGDFREGLLRGRQPDQLERAADQRLEPLHRERKMAAPLVPREGVNLIHDHRLDLPQRLPRPPGGEVEEERLGRGDEDVRRALDHSSSLGRPGIARTNLHADGLWIQPLGTGQLVELFERLDQILLDVVSQRLERRDVEHARPILKPPLESLAKQLVDAGEKRGERLARARRRGDKDVPPLANRWPALSLRSRSFAEPPGEPALHERMKALQRVVHAADRGRNHGQIH